MNQNKVDKPDNLIAAIIYLSIAGIIGLLNVTIYLWFDQLKGPDSSLLEYACWRILYLVDLIWLIYAICKGYNWSRFHLLILEIVFLAFLITHLFHHYHIKPVLALHILIHISFILIGLFLLFKRETSNWFKHVKQLGSDMYDVSSIFNISSKCLYIALGIGVLNYLIFTWNTLPNNINYCFFFSLATELMVIGMLNILFIRKIRSGSKLAGIIYFLVMVLAQTSQFTPIQALLVNFKPMLYCQGLLEFIQIAIQLTAFIFLFQKDIINSFRNKKY